MTNLAPWRHPSCRRRAGFLSGFGTPVSAEPIVWVGNVDTGKDSVLILSRRGFLPPLPAPRLHANRDRAALAADRFVVDVDPDISGIIGLDRHDPREACCLNPPLSLRQKTLLKPGPITARIHAAAPSSRLDLPPLDVRRLIGRTNHDTIETDDERRLRDEWSSRADTPLIRLGALVCTRDWPTTCDVALLWGSDDGQPVGWEKLGRLSDAAHPHSLTSNGYLRSLNEHGHAAVSLFSAPPSHDVLGAVGALAFTAEQMAL